MNFTVWNTFLSKQSNLNIKIKIEQNVIVQSTPIGVGCIMNMYTSLVKVKTCYKAGCLKSLCDSEIIEFHF